MKKIVKKIYRNMAVSILVLSLCVYALYSIQTMRFIDSLQTWVVYGTVLICMIIFMVYLYLLAKELWSIKNDGT